MSNIQNTESALNIFKRLRGNQTNREVISNQNNYINVSIDEHKTVLKKYNEMNRDIPDLNNIIYFVQDGQNNWVNVNLSVDNKFIKDKSKFLYLLDCEGVIVRKLQINKDIIIYDNDGIRLDFIPASRKRNIYIYVNLRYASADSLFNNKMNTRVNPSTSQTYRDRTVTEFIDFIIRETPVVENVNNNNSDSYNETKLDNQYLKPPPPKNDGTVTQNNDYTPSPTFDTVPQQFSYITNTNQIVNYNSNIGGDINIQNINYESEPWPDIPYNENNENVQEDLASWNSKFDADDINTQILNTIQNMEDNINEIQQGAEPQPINFNIENIIVKGDIPDLDLYPELDGVPNIGAGDYNILDIPPTFNVGQYGIYLPRYLTNKWAILGVTTSILVGSFTYLLYLNPQYGESIKNTLASITTKFANLLRPATPGKPYKFVKVSPDSDFRVEAVIRNHQELIDFYVQYILTNQDLNVQEHSLIDPLLKNMVVDTISYKSDDYEETATYINLSETLIRNVNDKTEPFNEFIRDASIIAGSAPLLVPTSDFGSDPNPLPEDVETALIDNVDKQSWLSYIWAILGFLGSKVIDLLTSSIGGALSFLGNSTIWLFGIGAAAIAYFITRK